MGKVRHEQVAELIKRNFSMVLNKEGRYIYEDAFVTVTNVVMSPDLGLAKIYLSVYNTDNKQGVLLSLEEQYSRLKRLLHHRMRRSLRRMPEFRMYIDDTLDEMERLNDLFNDLSSQDS